MAKKIALIAIVLIVLIQFFKPEKNISASPQPMAIGTQYAVPPEVGSVLKTACNDCHSNNTRYPWYSNIQPFAWFLSDHVKDGKKELNFDEFNSYSFKKQDHKLKEVVEVIQEGEMPLTSYTLVHTDAKLNKEQQQQLIDWANAIRGELKSKLTVSNPQGDRR